MQGFFQQIYYQVRKIPEGKVVTYGQIAALVGKPGAARTVGWALHQLADGTDVPWHRVINSQGRISTSYLTHDPNLQRKLLEREGVIFNKNGCVDLKKFAWKGQRKTVCD